MCPNLIDKENLGNNVLQFD